MKGIILSSNNTQERLENAQNTQKTKVQIYKSFQLRRERYDTKCRYIEDEEDTTNI